MWVTGPLGVIGDLRNHRPHRHCNRCSHWHDGLDMRCALSPDRRTAIDQPRTTGRSQIRIGGSVPKHVPAGIIPGSSVSVVASLDICRHVVHSRTRPYHLDLRAGSFSPTLGNNGTTTIDRETPHRLGPHPHRSIFTSSKPHAIITHPTIFISFTTGYFDQSSHHLISLTEECASTTNQDWEASGDRGSACRGCYRENIGASDGSLEQFIISRRDRTGGTHGRPVSRLVGIGDWSR